MKETKRVDASFLEGKEPMAVGYKVFNWDWTGYGGYSYVDENGVVEGGVHTVIGELSECGWGLHYCENPMDCMQYRDIIQWNKFALVEAYDENIKVENNGKSVCRTLLIKKVLSFNEMIEACESYQKKMNTAEAVNGISDGISNSYGISISHGISNGSGINGGYGISDSHGISNGYGISSGYGISISRGISYGSGINGGYGINGASGISNSYGISNGYGVNGGSGISDGCGIDDGRGVVHGRGICDSSGICNGRGVHCGSGISNGYGINYGYGIRNSYGIGDSYGISDSYGIHNSYGVYNSKHCRKCNGISRCLFCYGVEGAKLMLFNRPVSEERFNEVHCRLGYWYPNFTNAEDLKQKYGNGDWSATPASAIEGRTAKEAYAEMSEELILYVKSLPEYDDEIFRKIIGADDKK